MIITIDTKKDSQRDLKAAISLLRSLMDDAPIQTTVSEEGASAFGAMFSEDNPDDDNEEDKPSVSADIEMY